jgi:hypothetical protein
MSLLQKWRQEQNQQKKQKNLSLFSCGKRPSQGLHITPTKHTFDVSDSSAKNTSRHDVNPVM